MFIVSRGKRSPVGRSVRFSYDVVNVLTRKRNRWIDVEQNARTHATLRENTLKNSVVIRNLFTLRRLYFRKNNYHWLIVPINFTNIYRVPDGRVECFRCRGFFTLLSRNFAIEYFSGTAFRHGPVHQLQARHSAYTTNVRQRSYRSRVSVRIVRICDLFKNNTPNIRSFFRRTADGVRPIRSVRTNHTTWPHTTFTHTRSRDIRRAPTVIIPAALHAEIRVLIAFRRHWPAPPLLHRADWRTRRKKRLLRVFNGTLLA